MRGKPTWPGAADGYVLLVLSCYHRLGRCSALPAEMATPHQVRVFSSCKARLSGDVTVYDASSVWEFQPAVQL